MKYIPGHAMLVGLNNAAIRANFNRAIDETRIDDIKDANYPVVLSFPHNDSEMRCEIVLNKDGDKVFLDMSFDAWGVLPDDGDVDKAAQVRMSFAT